MEKNFRLFVKNLPLNINETRIKELFEEYATIQKIDLKEKKDLDDKINKFAFINITTTDQQLHTCFGKLNGERIDGFQISVELAKESFLERLKKERSENDLKKQRPTVQINEEYLKCNSFNNVHSVSKPKHQTFSDFDFSSNDIEVKETKAKKKQNIEYEENEESYIEESTEYQESEQKDSKQSKDFQKTKKREFTNEDYSNELDSINVEVKKKLKDKKRHNSMEVNNNKLIKSSISEMPIINESEKKRLMSLKQKRQSFKIQERTIRNALRFVDNNNKSNNKIVFNDDIDFEISKDKTENHSSKKNTLFDSDDEGQEKFNWNEDELDAKANLKKKLLKLQTNIGNDKRFVLDERFVDDENIDNDNKQENSDGEKVIDERKWQLNILENVLGKSITTPIADSDVTKKKNRMIRYDPSASNHQDYEVTIEKPKQEKPVKKKRKSSISEVKEDIPVTISKELFYDVSEKLVDSLKKTEGFSLLKTLGRDTLNDDSKNNTKNETEESKQSFQFNFNSKNPFRYDSSDDEGGNEETNETNTLTKSKSLNVTESRQKDDRLFFTYNDSRFQEAEHFFKNQIMPDEGAFKRRRRELKEIVRSKIRNNLKKATPWNRKKVRKIQKK